MGHARALIGKTSDDFDENTLNQIITGKISVRDLENRKRKYESDISSEYIHSLNIYYDRWISKLPENEVLVVKTDNFNIFQDKDFYKNILDNIENKLNV